MIFRLLANLFKKKPASPKAKDRYNQSDANTDDTKISVKKDKSDKVYATSKTQKPAQKLLTRHRTKKGAEVAATAFRHDVKGISGKIRMYDKYK
jgi:pyocin large subunit-like protein